MVKKLQAASADGKARRPLVLRRVDLSPILSRLWRAPRNHGDILVDERVRDVRTAERTEGHAKAQQRVNAGELVAVAYQRILWGEDGTIEEAVEVAKHPAVRALEDVARLLRGNSNHSAAVVRHVALALIRVIQQGAALEEMKPISAWAEKILTPRFQGQLVEGYIPTADALGRPRPGSISAAFYALAARLRVGIEALRQGGPFYCWQLYSQNIDEAVDAAEWVEASEEDYADEPDFDLADFLAPMLAQNFPSISSLASSDPAEIAARLRLSLPPLLEKTKALVPALDYEHVLNAAIEIAQEILRAEMIASGRRKDIDAAFAFKRQATYVRDNS